MEAASGSGSKTTGRNTPVTAGPVSPGEALSATFRRTPISARILSSRSQARPCFNGGQARSRRASRPLARASRKAITSTPNAQTAAQAHLADGNWAPTDGRGTVLVPAAGFAVSLLGTTASAGRGRDGTGDFVTDPVPDPRLWRQLQSVWRAVCGSRKKLTQLSGVTGRSSRTRTNTHSRWCHREGSPLSARHSAAATRTKTAPCQEARQRDSHTMPSSLIALPPSPMVRRTPQRPKGTPGRRGPQL